MANTPAREGRYIYCIIASDRPEKFGPLGIGGRNDELYTITGENVAAVVSDSPVTTYPLSRENLIAHEKAIEQVMKRFTVLPVRFCTIAGDDTEVRDILAKARDKFNGLLRDLAGKKELGLKAVFKDTVYADILEKYRDIKALKEKIADLPFAQTHSQRMEIGRLVENALRKEKELSGTDILNSLSPLAEETKVNSNYGELMLLSAAFLVRREKEAAFDKAVNKLDAEHGGRIRFRYVGTLPPFNFVNLVIETRKIKAS